VIEKTNPDGMHVPPGYHHVTVADVTRTVFLAGQCPLDSQGVLIGPDDLLTQVDQVVANIATALAAAGATPAEVVRTVIYVASPDRDDLAAVWTRLRDSPVAAAFTSASTLLGISQLGFPGQLVEIDVTATPARYPAGRRGRGSAAPPAVAVQPGARRGGRRSGDRWLRTAAQTVRSDSVGESRAARTAGSRPAIAPMTMAEAIPPAQATVGMTIAQSLVEA
jgi:enamine deaminase RidA (YjgF/YER057c/UK114 family)